MAFSHFLSVMIVWLGRCDLNPQLSLGLNRWTQPLNQRISAALRHWPTSIITSLGTVAERDTGNVFP
jgi:hypothetical protein